MPLALMHEIPLEAAIAPCEKVTPQLLALAGILAR